MDKIKLKPCPVCGRIPKVRYRAFGCCGAWVKVRCKPLAFSNIGWTMKQSQSGQKSLQLKRLHPLKH